MWWMMCECVLICEWLCLSPKAAFLLLIFKEKSVSAKERKKSAKNLFSVSVNEMTDGLKGLCISELFLDHCDKSGVHHMHALVAAAADCLAGRKQPQNPYTTRLSQDRR